MSLLRWLLGLVRRPKRARRPRDARGRFARRFQVSADEANALIRDHYAPALRNHFFAPNGSLVELKARSRLLAVRDARGRFVRFTRIEARTPRRRQQKQK